jgi:hypothetical protein
MILAFSKKCTDSPDAVSFPRKQGTSLARVKLHPGKNNLSQKCNLFLTQSENGHARRSHANLERKDCFVPKDGIYSAKISCCF